MTLSDRPVPAAINLADLYRQLGRDSDAEIVLRTAISASRADAGLHHALGLTLTRQKRPDDALAEFRRATEIEPDQSRYVYVFAIALHSSGRADESIKVLKENLSRHPDNRETLMALVTFSRDGGDIGAAIKYAEQLSRLNPNDRDLTRLTDSLRERSKR
jgi:Flp pilus assembly protein TadD